MNNIVHLISLFVRVQALYSEEHVWQWSIVVNLRDYDLKSHKMNDVTKHRTWNTRVLLYWQWQ